MLGYREEKLQLACLVKAIDGYTLLDQVGGTYRYCKNHEYNVCNWLLANESEKVFCTACALNRTIPNLNDASNLEEWRKLERAKHRLVYGLLRLGLPVVGSEMPPENRLAFDFLSSDARTKNEKPIRTGHLNGLITINIAEADSVHREYMRKQMAEPYRTLIGHFRHEVGHYYWALLVRDAPALLDKFRYLFGDERTDYALALQNHYNNGGPQNWQLNYISKYAASHSWEDWAETWAHYLHLVDMLETAFYFGMETGSKFLRRSPLKMQADFDPYQESDFDLILEAFVPLTYALNSLNRSMGQPDIYPFVIPNSVVEKLRFIHELLNSQY